MGLSAQDTTNDGSHVRYMPLEDVEKLDGYRPGGFHPMAIEDLLHDRYLVVHKLGFGAYSTTWLARDQTACRYVAIKVALAASDSHESIILHHLGGADLGYEVHPGKAIIPPLMDEFVLNGPNGRHRCFVTVPAGMSIDEAQDASCIRLFQLPVARAIAAQLIQAVAFLHSRGVVRGDLHPGNILLRLPEGLDRLSSDQLYKKYGEPHAEPVVRLDDGLLPKGVPTHGIVAIWFGKGSELILPSEAGIFLTDFGESYLPSNTARFQSNTPRLLVPPEVYFMPKERLSFPADIWTLACTVWTIIGQRPLFEGFMPSAEWVTKEHVEVFGKLPHEWWQKWEARSKWFDEEGSRNGGSVGRPWTERFEYSVQKPRLKYGMEEVGEDEKTALFVMLQSMMAFRPEERPTAEKILEFEWMRKWALPELERMRKML